MNPKGLNTDSGGGGPRSILLINQAWFKPELTALGNQVLSAGWNHARFDICFERGITVSELLRRLPEGFFPDVIVYLDDSASPSVFGLEECEIPTIFISVDIHHHHSWHRAYAAVFNRTLVAQQDYLESVYSFADELKSYALWFPLWAPRYVAASDEKTIDVCFRGTLDSKLHPKRSTFFKRLGELVSIDAQGGPYAEAYRRARIVVNQTVSGDLNFRVFEALQCGALLITPRIGNGLTELFEPGREIVLYEEDDAEDAARLIRYYLSHEDQRREIAAAGHAKVLQAHTAEARARHLLQHISALPYEKPSQKYFGAAQGYLHGVLSEVVGKDEDKVQLSAYGYACLQNAAAALQRSVERREREDQELEVAVLNAVVYARQFRIDAIGLQLSRAAFNACPENIFLRMNLIEQLMHHGAEADAALLIGADAEGKDTTLGEIEALMRQAHQAVLTRIAQRPTAQSSPQLQFA